MSSKIPVYTVKEPVEFANKQLHIFWLPDEVKLEKDIHDILTNFTESEKHGVISTLKLFSLYEIFAGDEFWGGRFKKIFDDASFHRMAAVFSMFEISVHGPLYNRINQLLHIDDEQFYMSYLDNPVLKARMEHIGAIIDHPSDLVSLGMFSMVEGVVLYSSFAFLKHFQSQGKNKLLNLVRGIDFSLRDENLHSVAGAWSYRYLKHKSQLSEVEKTVVEELLVEGAQQLYEHEVQIIKMIFEKGKIEGITETQLTNFVQSRVNECLKQLDIKPIFQVTYNPISAWFYKSITDFQFNDFFSGVGSEYQRNWDETSFVWKKAL